MTTGWRGRRGLIALIALLAHFSLAKKDGKRDFTDQERSIHPVFLHPTRLKCGLQASPPRNFSSVAG